MMLSPDAMLATKRMPFVCRGSSSPTSKKMCFSGSNSIQPMPITSSSWLACMPRKIPSTAPGSIVSGCRPMSPSMIAESVPCPLPVNASDPYSVTWIEVASAATDSSCVTNSRAAFIGPVVCELDGPIPILKMSNMLIVAMAIVSPLTAASRCRRSPRCCC